MEVVVVAGKRLAGRDVRLLHVETSFQLQICLARPFSARTFSFFEGLFVFYFH